MTGAKAGPLNLVWATDVHFDFVDADAVRALCERIRAARPSAVLLGGDIAVAKSVDRWVRFVAEETGRPVYFVLGNHDYYGGTVADVRQAAAADLGGARWLPKAGVVRLTERTALVGHGGWGDARLGTFVKSGVQLTDYYRIADLREAYTDKESLQEVLQAFGTDAAETLRPLLTEALEAAPEVVVLTHVPPFREACWYEGKTANDDWAPGFTCKAVGDVLLELAAAHPERKLTVLCGHTHSPGEVEMLPNLEVITAGAEYHEPDFQVIEVA